MNTIFHRLTNRWLCMLLPILLVVAALSFWSLSSARALSAIVYVNAATGNDANDGSTPALAVATIGAGMTAVDIGGTVNVAAGTYNEQVTINKNGVTLQGAGLTTVLDGLNNTGNGITLAGGVSNITIADLLITNYLVGVSSAAGASDILFEDVASNDNDSAGIAFSGGVAISNITFRRVTANENKATGLGRGIMLQSMDKTNIVVEDGTFLNNRVAGIDINDGGTFGVKGIRITGNTVSGGAGVGQATDAGIAVISIDNTGPFPNNISNNTITMYGRYGIEVKNSVGNSATSGNGSIVVSNNTITKAGGPFGATGAAELRDIAGIAVYERTTLFTDPSKPTSGVVVMNNTVNGIRQANAGSTSTGFGIVVSGNNQQVVNNTVTNSDVGIQVQQGFNQDQAAQGDTYFGRDRSASAANAILRYNDLRTNTIGFRNVAVPAPVNVGCNWWGDVSGPTLAANTGGTGQTFTGAGSFSPWLVYGTDADGVASGFQLPTAFTLTAPGDISPANNDYRQLANGIGCVQTGQTVTLAGTFDWAATNAAADWVLGADKQTGTDDDYSVLVPANVNDVTLTAASLGAATIQGPGDLAAANLEGFLYFDGSGLNQRWTIEKLRIYDLDLSIGMFFGAGGVTGYNGTTIRNNAIRIPKDLNATVAPIDINQNIGIHYAFGTGQTIADNLIDFAGDGVSNTAGGANATSVGMQSNTSGGAVYEGLQITGNILHVLNAQSADPETILGIWENAHGHTSTITVSNNQFVNLAAGNDPLLNRQRAFRITSHSSASTTVLYANNTVQGANAGFAWLAGADFTGNQPVVLRSNTLSAVGTGIKLDSNGLATLQSNTLTNTVAGVSIGLDAPAGTTATLVASPSQNSFTGFGTAINAAGAVTIGNGTTISGGTTGLVVTGAAANVVLGGTAFSGQSANYITLDTSPTDLDGRTSTFEGVLGSALTSTQYAAVQAKITDKNDTPALGLVLLADPQLTLDTATLSFAAVAGAPAPVAQSFTISNPPAASGAFDWTVSAPVYGAAGSGWLTCAPTSSGTALLAGSSAPVSCQVNSLALAPGVYTATLTVASPTTGVIGSPQSVGVTLTVTALGIRLAPNSATIATNQVSILTLAIDAIQQNDMIVVLSSSNGAISSVPATVIIPAGALTVDVPVTSVAIGGPVTITATLPAPIGGSTAIAQVTVAPVGIIIAAATTNIPVGSNGDVTITISSAQPTDTTITLSSSLPGVVSIGSTAVIPANATSVTVPVTSVASGGPATITAALPAALGGGTTSIEISVATIVISMEPGNSTIPVGGQGTLTVNISPAQSGNTTVALSSSAAGTASVPATVVIPAGQTSATVLVTGVATGGPVTITAALPAAVGGGIATAQVTVATVGVTLTPATSTIAVGANATLTVKISPAQSSATTVTLTSSAPGTASVPATVVIPAGQTSATVSVAGVAAGGPVTITATLPAAIGGGTATAQVTVTAVPQSEYKLLLPIIRKVGSV